ncbi:MAG: EAL domain-containing protein [Gammaproteobacteria bacterium]|nr:EAL domain-containing protein [Gammaproteobacteria bacterium]
MIGNRIPRFLLFATVGAVVLLALFYAQYQWLARQIVETSAEEHFVVLQRSFETSALTQAGVIADSISAAHAVDTTAEDWPLILNRALVANSNITGLRFTTPDGLAVQSGSLPVLEEPRSTSWLTDRLVTSTPVVSGQRQIGFINAAFPLDDLQAELEDFESQLLKHELETHLAGYLWMGLGTLAVLLVSAGITWLTIRRQSKRLRHLKIQAEKLGDADFGERLPEDPRDAIGDLAAVFNDMRDRLRETAVSRDYVDSILSGMNEAIIVTAADGKIIRTNAATTHLLGYEEDELLDTSIDFIIDTKKAQSLADDAPSGLPKESMFQSKYGESIPVSYTCSVIGDPKDGTRNRIYAAQNTTERRRAEKRIRYLARIDPLTKIPNRMQFQHLLQRNIARARRAGKSLCLFYLDIDRFKEINDTFGHLAGDTTLETVAERLKLALPKHAIAGRLAGDEFAVIVGGLAAHGQGLEKTKKLAQRLLDDLAEPFFMQGHEVFMTASMGIAYYPDDAPNVIDLIRNADAALYHAKKNGGNEFSFYSMEMNQASVERLMTKSKLKRAFERDELLVHYQPKYNLQTGEVFGAEALVRWELPERGLVLPSDFIPIAEETSLIIEIGEWVLDKVCEDFRAWQRSVASPGRVSVNLSLKQLRQINFIKRIGAILRSHQVSPTSLELEITETTLMENPQRTIKILDQLYGLGLHLAIDDFGTGYSSLSALQQFPISTLKIDQSFVRDAVTNPDDATLVDTIIKMGRNLNMDVVAEGVENEEQLNFLQTLGCNYVQGLLFGDPMSSDNYLELLLAQEQGTDTYRALFA